MSFQLQLTISIWSGDNPTQEGQFGGVKTYFMAQFSAGSPQFTSYSMWDLASSQLSFSLGQQLE